MNPLRWAVSLLQNLYWKVTHNHLWGHFDGLTVWPESCRTHLRNKLVMSACSKSKICSMMMYYVKVSRISGTMFPPKFSDHSATGFFPRKLTTNNNLSAPVVSLYFYLPWHPVSMATPLEVSVNVLCPFLMSVSSSHWLEDVELLYLHMSNRRPELTLD